MFLVNPLMQPLLSFATETTDKRRPTPLFPIHDTSRRMASMHLTSEELHTYVQMSGKKHYWFPTLKSPATEWTLINQERATEKACSAAEAPPHHCTHRRQSHCPHSFSDKNRDTWTGHPCYCPWIRNLFSLKQLD